jgi:hypothetical protein
MGDVLMEVANLFLVEFTLQTVHYMSDPEHDKLRRLVLAEDADEAMTKVMVHYESQSRPHDVSFYVTIDSCEGVLI